MIQYKVSVRLGGSTQQVVPNKVVTIPELALLKAIHGPDAVNDIRPADSVERSDDAERERLKKRYDHALPDQEGSLVDKMFSPFQPLPRRLSAIGMDPGAEAARLREQAAAALAAADELDAAPLGAGDPDDDVDELFGEKPAAASGRSRKAAEATA